MLCLVLPFLGVSASFQGPELPRKEVEPQVLLDQPCHQGILDKNAGSDSGALAGRPRFCIYHKSPGDTGAACPGLHLRQ